LHPETSLEKLPMDCMLPLSHPVMRGDSRVSGPLWIGSMGDQGAMASMTEERALAMCTDSYGEEDVAGWSEADFEREARRVSRSVKNIHEESGVIDSPHHIIVDDLSSWLGIQGPPSPRSLVECLKERGFRAGLTHYGKPSIRTDAPWDEILEATMSLQPPM
jgi:tRNA G26 N,N-dimethylase Trm1